MFMRVRAYRLKPGSISGDSLETKTAAPRQGHHFAGRPTRFLHPPCIFLTTSRLERSRCGGGRFRVRMSRLLWLPGSLVRREGGFSVNQLRQLMLEELQRRNFATTTIRTYLHGVAHFSRYFRRPPDQLGPEDIRHLPLA
jgi:hypothetical protein